VWLSGRQIGAYGARPAAFCGSWHPCRQQVCECTQHICVLSFMPVKTIVMHTRYSCYCHTIAHTVLPYGLAAGLTGAVVRPLQLPETGGSDADQAARQHAQLLWIASANPQDITAMGSEGYDCLADAVEYDGAALSRRTLALLW
jgi:hypothetical protein